jgi:uncharacterized protein YoxC
MTQFKIESNYQEWKRIMMEHKTVVISLVIGLLLGGGLGFVYMNNKMLKTVNLLNGEISNLEDELQVKTGQIENLEEDNQELQSTVQQKNTQIASFENKVEELSKSINASTKDIEDLEDDNQELQSIVQQKNTQIASFENKVEELSKSLSEYESQIQIAMLGTGTEWESSVDYDLESSFPIGYSEDFLVIYDIENIYHSLIYRIAIDIYIISGGTIYDSHHHSSVGSIPYEGDWFQSFYNEFDISNLSNGYYTVIVTATDLITGESNAKAHNFEITLD